MQRACIIFICASCFCARSEFSSAQVRTRSGKPLSEQLLKEQPDDPTSNPRIAWIACDNFVPAELPGPAAKKVTGGHTFRYMESCKLADESDQVGDTTYRLLVRSTSDNSGIITHYGWIDARLLVMTNEAEKQSDTSIYRKVMIVNSEADLVNDKSSQLVPIRLEPQANAATVEPCRLFQLFFKWGESTGPDGVGYVLIGSNSDFNATSRREAIGTQVLGWIPATRVCRWDTREALYWDAESTQRKPRRTERGYVWRSAEDAHKAFTWMKAGGVGKLPVEPVAREGWDDKGRTVEIPPSQMRFPILEITRQERDELEKRGLGEHPGWELCKVGVVGDFVDDTGKVIATASELADLQSVLQNLQEQMKRIEILFVIDDTSSMRPWFARTADTVQNIVNTVRTEKQQDVRIGIAFYNDTDGQQPDHQPVTVYPLVDAQSKGGAALIETLRNHRPQDGGDPAEMIFEGIERGVREVAFSPNARKLVILLGDAGDHAGMNVDRIGRVVQALTPRNQSQINFNAILVLSPKDIATAKAAGMFQLQMQALVTKLNALNDGRERAVYASIDDTKQVEDKIIHGYRSLVEEADTANRRIAELQRGQWGAVQLPPETRAAIERRRVIDLDRLLKTRGGVQLFQLGYVWVRSNAAQDLAHPDPFRELLLLSGGDVAFMRDQLKGLQLGPNEIGSVNPKEVVTNTIVKQLGQTNKNESWAGIILKARGLKVKSPLLNLQIERIRPGTFSARHLIDLEYKQQLLEDVLQDRRYRYVKIKQNIAGDDCDRYVKEGEPSPAKRSFHIGDFLSANWYWIDMREEWP